MERHLTAQLASRIVAARRAGIPIDRTYEMFARGKLTRDTVRWLCKATPQNLDDIGLYDWPTWDETTCTYDDTLWQ